MGITATISAKVHDANIPSAGMLRANTSIKATLVREKTVFSTGTQDVWRNPVKTLSCSTKIHQPMVARMNQIDNAGLSLKNFNAGDLVARYFMNMKLIVDDPTRLARYDSATKRLVRLPAMGMNRIKALIKLSSAIPAIKVIAAIMAELIPTV